MGGVVGGDPKGLDCVSCNQIVEDEEGWVRCWCEFEGKASGKIFSSVVGGWGVSDSGWEERCDGKVGDHGVVEPGGRGGGRILYGWNWGDWIHIEVRVVEDGGCCGSGGCGV